MLHLSYSHETFDCLILLKSPLPPLHKKLTVWIRLCAEPRLTVLDQLAAEPRCTETLNSLPQSDFEIAPRFRRVHGKQNKLVSYRKNSLD